MEDLSHLLPGSPVDALTPSAQGSPGSRHSSREAASTAPGSLPALSDDEADQPGPHLDAQALGDGGRHLVHGSGERS